MKKIFLTLGAVLVFSIASAQTDPKQAQVPQTPPATTKIETDKTVKEVEITKDAIDKDAKPEGQVQPRKDEIKTREHVKSVPKPATATDTVKAVNKTKRKKS